MSNTSHEIQQLKLLESECQRVKRDLEESNRSLTVFAHTVAHELREPLSIILGYCTLLKESGLEPKEVALAQLGRILAGANRLNTTIESLLAISRLNGTVSVTEEVDLNQCANEALENLRAKIRSAVATVQIEPLPVIRGNHALLTQLFQNLLSNAIKFRSARPPVVHVLAVHEAGVLSIKVSDNGIGIDETHHDKIFEYFKRLNGRDKYDGSGLGLAISKRIVEFHGGKIRVESRSGIGATFIVELPLNVN